MSEGTEFGGPPVSGATWRWVRFTIYTYTRTSAGGLSGRKRRSQTYADIDIDLGEMKDPNNETEWIERDQARVFKIMGS